MQANIILVLKIRFYGTCIPQNKNLCIHIYLCLFGFFYMDVGTFCEDFKYFI